MAITVAVAGASGYAGGEVLRLLLNHPAYLSGELEIGALTGHSTAGQSVGALMPHLPQLRERRIVDTTIENLSGHDVVFLGLPHGHSAEIGKALGEEVLVIDCAADFRLKDKAAWDDYYGGEYAGSWPYGIPEMPGHREAIAQSKRVAVAGCFPTTTTLGALPAVAKGLIEPDISVIAVTGVSGAGKKASVAQLGAETMGNVRAYKPGGSHRHTPEMVQNLSEYSQQGTVAVSFTPVLAPMPRGILATCSAPVTQGVTAERVREAYRRHFDDEPFVEILPDGVWPQTAAVVGSNRVSIQVTVDPAAGRLIAIAAEDNLTKGTAGGAIQSMNIALGLPETTGLSAVGVAP